MIHVDNALRALTDIDPWLNPHTGDIRMHLDRYNDVRWRLAGDGSIVDFANGHHYFGFHRTGYEMGDVNAVMDGKLEGFVTSYLQKL